MLIECKFRVAATASQEPPRLRSKALWLPVRKGVLEIEGSRNEVRALFIQGRLKIDVR